MVGLLAPRPPHCVIANISVAFDACKCYYSPCFHQIGSVKIVVKREVNIMKNLIIAIGLLIFSGCMSADCFIAADATPQKGERYKLYFNTLKVVQVCEDEVHVIHHSYEGLRVCVIPIVNDYVTGGYLRPGTYEYIGPYTYKTIKDMAGNEQTHTVRMFKEVNNK